MLSAYMTDSAAAALRTDFTSLAAVTDEIIACRSRGGVVYTAGNGGSAATASHMTNDLTKGCRALGREGVRSICLFDSMPVISCLANDFSYEDAPAIELGTLGNARDLLVVYSGSGNSENIVRCVKEAMAIGMKTVAFTGRDGGKLKELCDISVIAASEVMEIIEDIHMTCEHAMATIVRSRLEKIWGAEIISRYPRGHHPSVALFDFDGTVSLIRQGWQEIMVPYFIEVLCETPAYIAAEALGRGREELAVITDCVKNFVSILTGKQTIFQCERLNDEVVARGGESCDPFDYKKEYLRRLMERIAFRREGLRNGDIKPSKLVVPGFYDFARMLRDSGIKLYLASGTDEADVIHEAELLGVTELFDGGIYGARDEIKDCSKELVIRKILEDNSITGDELISFGDGYVEIELIANIGGYAVGVATDESFLIEKASGKVSYEQCSVDEWKRERLKRGGAAAIIPDFTGITL